MKASALLSIKQLAELLGVSTDTIRRAARKGLIPSTRERTAYRFDLEKVHRAMRARANAMVSRRSTKVRAPGGVSRPRATPSPPIGNTGAHTTGMIPGGPSSR